MTKFLTGNWPFVGMCSNHLVQFHSHENYHSRQGGLAFSVQEIYHNTLLIHLGNVEAKVVSPLSLLHAVQAVFLHYCIGIILRKTWNRYLFPKSAVQIFTELLFHSPRIGTIFMETL